MQRSEKEQQRSEAPPENAAPMVQFATSDLQKTSSRSLVQSSDKSDEVEVEVRAGDEANPESEKSLFQIS